nr:glycosyl hydrolase family 18 protein [Halobacillus trueperi]
MYVAKQGDGLWQVSKKFNINVEEIAQMNGLHPSNQLVHGQALLLPGQTYYVQPGESLWEISKRHSLTTQELKKHNNLSSDILVPEQMLSIPKSEKMSIWAGKYFLPSNVKEDKQAIDQYQSLLSGLFLFEYHPDLNGNLSALNDQQTINYAWKRDITPYATITNLSEDGFDPQLARELLSKPNKRSLLIQNIYSLLREKDFKGVVIDFEGLDSPDRVIMNTFMKELTQKLHSHNMEVHVTAPPMRSDHLPSHNAAYDYEVLGRYVDKIFLMTYDWHWPGGPSGPIAPLPKVRETLDYAVSVIPRSKIMLGIPMYAYNWTLSKDGVTGTAHSAKLVDDLFLKHESEIHYDFTSSSPWFRYKDRTGKTHEVWFEDSRSLLAKYRLVKEYNIAGMGCWKLGLSIPQAELMQLEEFNTE